MNRREFLKHTGSAGGGVAASVVVIKYILGENKKDIEDHEKRLRELEAYKSATSVEVINLKSAVQSQWQLINKQR